MRIVLDPHFAHQATQRGVDVSMLLFLDCLKHDLKNLLSGERLIKTHKGSTLVFKKSNTSQTVYLKTAWTSCGPVNNQNYHGEKQC